MRYSFSSTTSTFTKGNLVDENLNLQEQIAALGQLTMDIKGQLKMTQVAIRTLLLTHPARDHALKTMADELERWEGAALNTLLPDGALKSLETAKFSILPTDEDLQRIQPTLFP